VREAVAGRLLQFWRFFGARAGPAALGGALSVRDLLAWARFVNAAGARIGALPAYAHGAHLVLLDGLGLGGGVPSEARACAFDPRSLCLHGCLGMTAGESCMGFVCKVMF
jgi:midasin